MISATFSYQKKHQQVLGREMAYVEEGSGDPVVFLYGNPCNGYVAHPFEKEAPWAFTALCWLPGTSVQKSWRHVPKRSIFPFALPSSRNAGVKKIASCLQEENMARKTKTHNIPETAIVLSYYDKYPPLHPSEYDFHDLCCSLVVMV